MTRETRPKVIHVPNRPGGNPDDDSMGEIFRDLKHFFQEKRTKNLETNTALIPKGWTCHTIYHYSTVADGSRLDYWPSRNKWMWGGKLYYGTFNDLVNFIKNRQDKDTDNG